MQTVEQLTSLKDQVSKLPVTESLAPAHHNSLLQDIVKVLGIVIGELIEHKKATASLKSVQAAAKAKTSPATPAADSSEGETTDTSQA